ncbi:MAG TPA: NADH-quinone oxidoreductase subunit C [Steroidobacteraceae bacterium]|jgi:NADH-quinone oxidoreductase subunit C|nr:NADH-quinone oxidoreductase subunit C [Steroidobacteraceae bacterium]
MTRVEATARAIESRIGARAVPVASLPGEVAIEVAAERLLAVCTELRDAADLAFEQLIDLSGIDYLDYGRSEWTTDDATSSGFSRGVERAPRAEAPATPGRFAVVYQLLSVSRNTRLRLRCPCGGGEPPMVDSVTGIWASADWYEREAFDLYGILFRGHPDLRRILTDYGFIGHPFRKDFPLSGHVEVRYDPSRGRVVYEPVSIEPRVTVPKVIRKEREPGGPGAGGHG